MLSIVVPTLNAAATLGRVLESVSENELVGEVIVVDGGSTDASVAIASCFDVVVISSEAGRGQQLAAGAAVAKHDWFLFLHGDSVMKEGWQSAVISFMRDEANTRRAGHFILRYDDANWRACLLERVVMWRSRVLGLPYGDQGLLISKGFYERLNGFEAIPIMEDVEFVRRIGRRRIVGLQAVIETSARRYRRSGYILRVARNLACLVLFFFGLAPKRIERIYGRDE